MTEKTLLHDEHESILTITFNRPEKYNAITSDMLSQLFDLVHRFREDDGLRVMILKANGKYYSAGMDIETGLAPETESGIEFRNWYRHSFHMLFDELEAIEKPVISAAQGPCLGGALEMALSCDFRLAASSAAYGLPETRIGALPGSGGTSRLTRLVGVAEAKWADHGLTDHQRGASIAGWPGSRDLPRRGIRRRMLEIFQAIDHPAPRGSRHRQTYHRGGKRSGPRHRPQYRTNRQYSLVTVPGA